MHGSSRCGRRLRRLRANLDPEVHVIIVEGNGWGNNYGGFPGPWDPNLVVSFHKYWNPNTE